MALGANSRTCAPTRRSEPRAVSMLASQHLLCLYQDAPPPPPPPPPPASHGRAGGGGGWWRRGVPSAWWTQSLASAGRLAPLPPPGLRQHRAAAPGGSTGVRAGAGLRPRGRSTQQVDIKHAPAAYRVCTYKQLGAAACADRTRRRATRRGGLAAKRAEAGCESTHTRGLQASKRAMRPTARRTARVPGQSPPVIRLSRMRAVSQRACQGSGWK